MEPWFDPNTYSWIPGTVYGTSLGLLGGLIGVLAPAGRGRKFCLSAWGVFMLIALGLLVFSGVALLSGQPYGIWYGLGLPGVLGLILCPIMLPMILQRYREAEERRMQAADFTEARLSS